MTAQPAGVLSEAGLDQARSRLAAQLGEAGAERVLHQARHAFRLAREGRKERLRRALGVGRTAEGARLLREGPGVEALAALSTSALEAMGDPERAARWLARLLDVRRPDARALLTAFPADGGAPG